MNTSKKFLLTVLTLGCLSLNGMEENDTHELKPKIKAKIQINSKKYLYSLKTATFISVLKSIKSGELESRKLEILTNELKEELKIYQKVENYFDDLLKMVDGNSAESIFQIKNLVYKLIESGSKYTKLFLKVIDDLLDYYPYYNEEFMDNNRNANEGSFFDIRFAVDEPFRIMNLLLEIFIDPENFVQVIHKYQKFYLNDAAIKDEYSLIKYFARMSIEFNLPNFLNLLLSLELLPKKFILKLLKSYFDNTHTKIIKKLIQNVEKEELECLLNDDSCSFLFKIIKPNSLDIAEIIFKLMERLDININEYVNQEYTDGLLIEHICDLACATGEENIVHFLLTKGAKVDIRNRLGFNVLEMIEQKMAMYKLLSLELLSENQYQFDNNNQYLSNIKKVYSILKCAKEKGS